MWTQVLGHCDGKLWKSRADRFVPEQSWNAQMNEKISVIVIWLIFQVAIPWRLFHSFHKYHLQMLQVQYVTLLSYGWNWSCAFVLGISNTVTASDFLLFFPLCPGVCSNNHWLKVKFSHILYCAGRVLEIGKVNKFA